MINHVVKLTVLGVILLIIGGCTSGAMQTKYQVGQTETVRFVSEDSYNNWVEMPDEAPTEKNGRVIKKNIEMTREIESVNPDGSAIMKVTLNKVDLSMRTYRQQKENLYNYVSTTEATKSDRNGDPKLAGASYKIKIAPDTTVQEIIGLDPLLKKLGIDKDDEAMVPQILSPETIKLLHERDFVKSAVQPGQTVTALIPVPNVMIKAQAVEQTFTAKSGGNLITVNITGRPIHTLPEGWDVPAQPGDVGRTIVKQASDMQEFKYQGQGKINTADGKVLSEQMDLSCTLILLEEKIFKGQSKKKKDKWGEMFTIVESKQTFEALP